MIDVALWRTAIMIRNVYHDGVTDANESAEMDRELRKPSDDE